MIISFIVKIIGIVMLLFNNTELNGVRIATVNSGDGLYKYNNKYIYRGRNPNNYILFDNELWRIISFEEDFIKIIKNESIGDMAFDVNDSNDWDNSSLKFYLNNSFYNNIDKEYKNLIRPLVAILSINDYFNVSDKCSNFYDAFNSTDCFKNNYINYIEYNDAIWTLSKENDTNSVFYVGNYYYPDIEPQDKFSIVPVIYLNKNIKLSGFGTINNPYKIALENV